MLTHARCAGKSTGIENVRQSIRLILQTEPLERIMLPEFGGGLKTLSELGGFRADEDLRFD